MKIRLSSAACGDLQSIVTYTRNTWGEAQADGYIEAIWEKPGVGEGMPFRPCREAHYFFVSRNSKIDVIRILHSSMDFKAYF